MSNINVSDTMWRQVVINTISTLCLKYLRARCDIAEQQLKQGWSEERLDGYCTGLIQSARILEKAFTGHINACVFFQNKADKMLMRQDIANAIQELREQIG